MKQLLLIFIAGGAGALLRYLVFMLLHRPDAFPWATMAVNIAGCAAFGFLAAMFTGPWLVKDEYRLAILVGLLGGLTTFSTFSWDTLQLLKEGKLGMAAANIALSNFAGIIAAWLGYQLANLAK